MNLEELENFYNEIKDIPELNKKKDELLKIKAQNDIIADKLKQKENLEREIKISEMKLEKLKELNNPLSNENMNLILYFQEDTEFFNKKIEKFLNNAFSESLLNEINGTKVNIYYNLSINRLINKLIRFIDHNKLENKIEEFCKNFKKINFIYFDDKNYFFVGEGDVKNLPIRNILRCKKLTFEEFFSDKNNISVIFSKVLLTVMKDKLIENLKFEEYKLLNNFYFKNTDYFEEDIDKKIFDVIMKHAVKYVKEIKELSKFHRSAKKNADVKLISPEIFYLDNIFLKINDEKYCPNRTKKKMMQSKIFDKLLNLFIYKNLKSYYANYANIFYLNKKNYISSNSHQNLCKNLMNDYANKNNFKSIFQKNEMEILNFINENYAKNIKINDEFFYENIDIPNLFLDIFISDLIEFLKSNNFSKEREKYKKIINFFNEKYVKHNKYLKNYKNFLSLTRIFSSTFEEILDLLEEDGFFLDRSDVKIIVQNMYKN